jgi:hypothetical protein
MNDVTQLLSALRQGDARATSRLPPLGYDELLMLAAQRMAQEQPRQTLQPTVLVHEGYLRLVGQGDPGWDKQATSSIADQRPGVAYGLRADGADGRRWRAGRINGS